MERHHKGRVISVFGKKFDSDLDIDIALSVIHFPELSHFTSVWKSQILDRLHIFLDSQLLQFPFECVNGVFVWKQVSDSKPVCITYVSALVYLTLSLECHLGAVLQRIS